MVCFQPPRSLIGKVREPDCNAVICVSHTLQSVLESGEETRNVKINFSAGFDRVAITEFPISSALWVLEVLCCRWHSFYQIVPSMLWWKVVGVNWLTVYLGCAAGKCFGPVIVPPVHLGVFSIMENKLIGDANDSTLIAVVSSPGVKPITYTLSFTTAVVAKNCSLFSRYFVSPALF